MLNTSAGAAARILAAAGAAGPACGASAAASGLAALSTASSGRLAAATGSHSPAANRAEAGACRCSSGSGCAACRAPGGASPSGARPTPTGATGASSSASTSSSRGSHVILGTGPRLGVATRGGSGLAAALAGLAASPSPLAATAAGLLSPSSMLQPGSTSSSSWGAARCVHAPAAASPPPDGASTDQLSLAALAAGLWEELSGGRDEGLTPAAIVAALDRHIVGQVRVRVWEVARTSVCG